MKLDTVKFRKLALAATQPGPWSVKRLATTSGKPAECTILDANGFWLADVGAAPKDAAFIAACSPEVVIALLDRLRVSEEQNAALGDVNEAITERDQLRVEVAEVTAARDEACAWIENTSREEYPRKIHERNMADVERWRAVGKEQS